MGDLPSFAQKKIAHVDFGTATMGPDERKPRGKETRSPRHGFHSGVSRAEKSIAQTGAAHSFSKERSAPFRHVDPHLRGSDGRELKSESSSAGLASESSMRAEG